MLHGRKQNYSSRIWVRLGVTAGILDGGGAKMKSEQAQMRLDKWLWAARFFKTRGLAQSAINGGKVHVKGQRVKPSHAVRPGDELSVSKGPFRFIVTVVALARQRGPASVAANLYEEHPESKAARDRLREERALQRSLKSGPESRPDKRARRQIVRFTRRREG